MRMLQLSRAHSYGAQRPLVVTRYRRCRRNWIGHPISQTVFSKFERPPCINIKFRRTRPADDSRRGCAGDAARKLHARMRLITHVDQRLSPLRDSEIAEFRLRLDRRALSLLFLPRIFRIFFPLFILFSSLCSTSAASLGIKYSPLGFVNQFVVSLFH